MATCNTPFGNDGDRKWHASPAKLAIVGTTGLCLTALAVLLVRGGSLSMSMIGLTSVTVAVNPPQ